MRFKRMFLIGEGDDMGEIIKLRGRKRRMRTPVNSIATLLNKVWSTLIKWWRGEGEKEAVKEVVIEEKEYAIIAQAKRGEFCLEAMKNIERYGYDIAELNENGDIVYKKEAGDELAVLKAVIESSHALNLFGIRQKTPLSTMNIEPILIKLLMEGKVDWYAKWYGYGKLDYQRMYYMPESDELKALRDEECKGYYAQLPIDAIKNAIYDAGGMDVRKDLQGENSVIVFSAPPKKCKEIERHLERQFGLKIIIKSVGNPHWIRESYGGKKDEN